MAKRHPFVFPCAFVLLVLVSLVQTGAQPAQNPLGLRPDHATAAVADLDRAIRWYQDVLGFALVTRGERPDGGHSAELAIPGYGVALVQYPGAFARPVVRSGWVHIVFGVPDPAGAYATLKARGADVTTRGNVAPAAINNFIMHDSEGNEIEIVRQR